MQYGPLWSSKACLKGGKKVVRRCISHPPWADLPWSTSRQQQQLGILSLPRRLAVENSRRELSGGVSFGIGILLVVEESRLENRPRGVCDTYSVVSIYGHKGRLPHRCRSCSAHVQHDGTMLVLLHALPGRSSFFRSFILQSRYNQVSKHGLTDWFPLHRSGITQAKKTPARECRGQGRGPTSSGGKKALHQRNMFYYISAANIRIHVCTRDQNGPLRPNGGSATRWIQRYVRTNYETYAVPVQEQRSVGIVIMPYTRLRSYPCERQNFEYVQRTSCKGGPCYSRLQIPGTLQRLEFELYQKRKHFARRFPTTK